MDITKIGLESSHGIERVASTHGFEETVSHFEQLVAAKGMLLFAKIDFTGDAKRAGLTMPRMIVAGVWESEGWDAGDGGCAEFGTGFAVEGARVGRSGRESLAEF